MRTVPRRMAEKNPRALSAAVHGSVRGIEGQSNNPWCPFPFLEQLGAPMDVVTAVCQGGDTQQPLMVLDAASDFCPCVFNDIKYMFSSKQEIVL